MKHIILILLTTFLFSCEYKHHERHCKIHCYQTGSGDDLLFWYLLYGNNNTYYVYQSSAPVSSFSGVAWSQQTYMPQELSNVQELEQIEEPLTELPDEIEVEMEAEPDQGQAESTESSESDSESSGESSGGDSGGGSDGGGDGGGGE
jgi:uncharacterized membrane protein YgcG